MILKLQNDLAYCLAEARFGIPTFGSQTFKILFKITNKMSEFRTPVSLDFGIIGIIRRYVFGHSQYEHVCTYSETPNTKRPKTKQC